MFVDTSVSDQNSYSIFMIYYQDYTFREFSSLLILSLLLKHTKQTGLRLNSLSYNALFSAM